MKNRFWHKILAGLSLWVFLGVHAAADSRVTVILSIQELKATLVESPVALNNIQVDVSDSEVIGPIVFQNQSTADPGVNQDYYLRISNQSGASWTQVTSGGALSEDQFRVRAIWTTHSYTMPPTSIFDAADILTTAGVGSTASVFGNSGDDPSVQGYNVSLGSYRSMFLWLEGPPSSSGGTSVTLTLELTPEETP